MIISMKLHATREEIDEVREQVAHFGYKVHSIEGEERVVIGVVGVGDVTACLESVEAMPQVEKVVRISAPYKFVSKEFRQRSEERRVGKECRSRCDWSSDVCSSDLRRRNGVPGIRRSDAAGRESGTDFRAVQICKQGIPAEIGRASCRERV